MVFGRAEIGETKCVCALEGHRLCVCPFEPKAQIYKDIVNKKDYFFKFKSGYRCYISHVLESKIRIDDACELSIDYYFYFCSDDLAPRNRASYNVRKKRKKTNKGAERRWQERITLSNRSSSSYGR